VHRLWQLFDLSKHRTGGKGAAGKLAAPQLLAQSTSIHARGVFSLDVWAPGSGSSGSGGDSGGSGGSGGSAAWADGVRVLTGSKDRQVCVSRLHASSSSSSSSSSSFVVDRAFDELHSGVVKCVHWADADTLGGGGGGQVFASGGQDRAVCVKDCRSASAAPDVAIADAHSGGVHTVHWGPSGSGGPLLLTAGHDPLIHLYDVRWPAAPAVTLDTSSSAASATLRHTFRGHASPHARKHGTILPPRFVSASVVVAAGEGSDCLSLYCATTGATLSRGAMPDQPIAIACRGGGGGGGSGGAATEVAVSCRRGGAIYLLNPQSS
jgi:WD40 repeat protein